MAYASLATVVTGTPISSTTFGNVVKDNFDAAFPLGVDAWTSYTPTLTQSATVTKTVTRATYQRVGRLIVAQFNLAVTSAGTAANTVLVGLPVAAASINCGAIGAAWIYDASATTRYVLTATVDNGTSTIGFLNDASGGGIFGITPAVTLASGDLITGTVTYEAAS